MLDVPPAEKVPPDGDVGGLDTPTPPPLVPALTPLEEKLLDVAAGVAAAVGKKTSGADNP